jgi:hypothetical protein
MAEKESTPGTPTSWAGTPLLWKVTAERDTRAPYVATGQGRPATSPPRSVSSRTQTPLHVFYESP